MKDETKFYQVLTEGEQGYPVCQDWFTSMTLAENEMKSFQKMWPGEWWIKEGTEYIKGKCKGCDTPYANAMTDAHGIPTGNWCDPCYNSDKYPYRKDKYPTMETHGYGDYLEDEN